MTTADKVAEAKNELKEWIDKSDTKDFYFDQAILKINEKLAESKVPKSIIVSFASLLDNWYSNNFVYDLLTKEATTFKIDTVANGYHILKIADILADQFPANPPKLLFDKAAYWLANCLSEKWYKESEELTLIINKGLATNFLKGGLDFKPAAWFILEIANKGFKNTVDYSKFNYPADMGVYKEALDNWNTIDMGLLDSILSKLCDFHLENATYGDEEDTAGIQFGSAKEFVYTFEILAWLSIRERAGLKNPDNYSHPLLNLTLNKLPVVASNRPKDELFDKIIEKLK